MILVLIVLAIGVAVLFAFAAARPNAFLVQRSTLIAAPAEKIFPMINDFRHWAAWSPWEARDPAMTKDYAGPASGKGARYSWSGAGKVGSGRMEIVESAPPRRVVIGLDVITPFAAHNTAEFALEPEGELTKVTWSMSGPQSFMLKVTGLLIDMDKAIGKDFAAGLSTLKAVSEK